MVSFDVNYVAIIVATIVAYVVGWIWYGPVFGKQWMTLQGWTKKDMEKMKKTTNMPLVMVVGFLSTLVVAFFLAQLVKSMDASGFAGGAAVGFFTWLGFVATMSLGGVLWERKPFSLYVLNNAHNVVIFIVMAGIIAVWP